MFHGKIHYFYGDFPISFLPPRNQPSTTRTSSRSLDPHFRAPSEDIPLQAPAKSIAPDEGNMKTLMFETQKPRISLYHVISCYISVFCKWIMWSMWWSFGSLKTGSFLNCSLSASFWSFCPFLFSYVTNFLELYHQNPWFFPHEPS